MKKVSIIVPMYNEEEAAPLFFEHIEKVINENKNYEFEIVAVNDGSKDNTLSILLEKQKILPHLVVVDLSRNWGHESAVTAGLKEATGDCLIPIDADLQDPPELIPELLKMWEEGYQVVNAQRGNRKKDSSFKKNTAGIYYKLLNHLSSKVKVPYNVANFRLLDRRVADHVIEMQETSRVFRVQVPFLGFKTGTVLFSREERVKGKSKYNIRSMFNLALSSIVSLTTRPLRWSIGVTVFFSCTFLLSAVTELVLYILALNNIVNISNFGFAIWLIINVMLFIACFMFFVLAVISVYLSQAVEDARRRPTVIVNKVYKK
ncbi:MAG: glycosyltransferase family 2 protein [Erysipelotrichaceae bacterium]|nr:glycosyltransferase family 2 protein [Erysipelotrichaceae bacterium]